MGRRRRVPGRDFTRVLWAPGGSWGGGPDYKHPARRRGPRERRGAPVTGTKEPDHLCAPTGPQAPTPAHATDPTGSQSGASRLLARNAAKAGAVPAFGRRTGPRRAHQGPGRRTNWGKKLSPKGFYTKHYRPRCFRPGGEPLSTASGGNLERGEVIRNKRSPQCGVAPIEDALWRSGSGRPADGLGLPSPGQPRP